MNGELDFLQGGGDMGALVRAHDWSRTALGPAAGWPQSLRSAAGIMLNSRYPIALYWGPELALLYNDAWRPIPGSKHPWALGRPAREVWPEIWNMIGPLFERVFATGEGTWSEDLLLPMRRHGYTEECYFNFTFSPIRGEGGRVEGIFNAVVETTESVLSKRRLQTLSELGAHMQEAGNETEACRRAARILGRNEKDVPFASIYLVDERGAARLVAAANLERGQPGAPEAIDVREADGVWPLARAIDRGEPVLVDNAELGLAELPTPWPERPPHSLVAPLRPPNDARPFGFLVAGVNARRRLDDQYRSFFDLAARQVATAVANARAYEAERDRAEQLSALDRAKTAFFSNVSHEFRTPLTLMLGPLEDLLPASSGLPAAARDRVSMAHRNALRLQKLVNSLLDFSRIEAGRVSVAFEPVELGQLTCDLASNFRSACEKAGLELRVDCPPLAEPIWVDRDMWEKIVLNLVSNAFKFTLEGAIDVALRENGDVVELEVRDTGVGIPAAELPRLFERFHRVENGRGRTYEGTGIGLALVQELVELHGGGIGVESELDRGSTFMVTIPRRRRAHEEPPPAARTPASTRTGASAYVEEALRWLPGSEEALPLQDEAERRKDAPRARLGRVLLADDNADMRDYVRRLLSERFVVETAADGRTAFELARRAPPDLVLADVMMPGLDGFALLEALRSEAATRAVPVVLLSARAGEEARIEGVAAGADDYLTKPFSARELLTRVEGHLNLARVRREGEQYFRELADAAPAMLWIAGPDGGRTYVSRGWCDFTGQTPDASLGAGWLEAVHPEDRARVEACLRAATASPAAFELDYRLRRRDGEYRWVLDASRPRMGRRGGLLGFVGSVIDVDERRKAEDALRDADRRKDEFLAVLGHELRNPLAPLGTGLELLDRARGKPELADSVRAMMGRQLAHLVRLVDDLLDLSRVSRGKVELQRARIDLNAVVDAAVEQTRGLVADHGHRLAVEPASEELPVYGDFERLTQVVANLLSNAAKYTERGGTLEVRAGAEGDQGQIRVRDDGLGIPPDKLEKVFEMFMQVPEHHGGAGGGGLGIGLALSRQLAVLHGGTIEARSEGFGHGSEFVLRVPLDRSAARTAAELPDGIGVSTPRRVMVVDDNADAAESLALLLEMHGHTVRVEHSGAAALEAAAEWQPDVALLDIGLPGMDGYEIARRLRAEPRSAPLVLVAVSGWGQAEDKQRAKAAGFDGHLTKPVDAADLTGLIERLTG